MNAGCRSARRQDRRGSAPKRYLHSQDPERTYSLELELANIENSYGIR
jgi:hypothetical protein